MRPRKKVLLFCEDEQRAAELAFAVSLTPNLSTAKALNDAQFQHMLKDISACWDLVVVVHSDSREATEERCLRSRRANDRPVLALNTPADQIPQSCSLSLPSIASMMAVVSFMRSMSARRRGPKKGTKRAEPPQQAARRA